MINIERYILLNEYQTNTYLLWDSESLEGILIDPAGNSEQLQASIKARNIKLNMVVNTHGHGDHIGGNRYYTDSFGCPLAIHAFDAPMLVDSNKNFSALMGFKLEAKAADVLLADEEELKIGSQVIKVIHTPGHTRGCICLYIDKILVSGDTLFEQSIGRTDLPGGSHAEIISSIRSKLFTLPDDVMVYPGHGPFTSIGLEKANNPFVGAGR